MALTRKKKIVFALVAMTLSFGGVLLLLLAADLVLHHRAERSAGLNRYGYRGPVVATKQPAELRVVVLGGSTVFGYGVNWNESIPAYLEAKLTERLSQPVRVVNLGFNNEGAFAWVPNLEDFAYLDYDVVVLYEGYNDLAGDEGVNRSVYRRNSAVYRLTGYYPILPLYLDEKVKMLRYGGDLNVAYEAERLERAGKSQVVFHPGLAQRTSAAALEAISSMTKALDGQLEKTDEVRPPSIKESESRLGCTHPFVTYCESITAAVKYGLSRGKGVVVGSQPRAVGVGPSQRLHRMQQEMLGPMLVREFGNEPRFSWADFSQLVDLHNPDFTFGGMHLNPQGNRVIAGALAPFVEAVATK